MPSYFNRRTIGRSDLFRHRTPSGYNDIEGPVQFTPVDTSQQRGKSQQGQHQSCRPSVTPQGFLGYLDSLNGSIPPPGHTYDNPSFRCSRCGHPFTSQVDLDHHSLVCGAAALLTGIFTPWYGQQNGGHHQPETQYHNNAQSGRA